MLNTKTLFFILLFVFNLSANERIISLSPSITEILFALDKGENIVATSSYSLYPKEAQNLPIIGGYETPHLEKILFFEPTLVVGQHFNQNTLEKLKRFDIKTLTLNLQTLKSIQNSILTLGKELNATSKAESLKKNITNALLQAKKNSRPHSVMIVYGLKNDLRNANYIAGNNIFFNEIITQCGNTNAYTSNSTSQPVLSYENIIALNPEQIIILHSHATEADIDIEKALNNWYSIPTQASKDKRISIVDENYLHIPSHRVALTIKRLCGEMND